MKTPSNAPSPSSQGGDLNPNLAFRFASVCIGAMAQLAVAILLGYWLDGQFGTMFLSLVGLGLGMVLATLTLIRFARKWTPKARRSAKEINDDQWQERPSDTDENAN
jgi:F0F1-type ATP synthase assembly protein I